MKQRNRICRAMPLMIAVLFLACILSGCGSSRTAKETEEITMGIDVARYQGTIDWERVSHSGVEFAMVRVGYRGMTDGEITPDSNGRYNLQEASKAGIKLGAYFFSTAITEEEAMEEAAWLADQIAGYPITYPVVYDCENFNDPGSRQYGMSKRERTNVALAFLKTIEKLGYEGMFYASKMDMENSNHWEMDRIDEDYKVWVAQYPAEPYPKTKQTSYSGIHQMWQYSMEGTVDGISTPVDLNIAYFGYDGIEKPKDKNPPAQVQADIEAMMDFDEVNEKVTAKEETNLRTTPSQGADSVVLKTLKNGEVAQRVAISSSGWSKLIFEGQTYYAVSSYLTTELTYGYNTDIVISAEADIGSIKTQFSEVNYLVTAKDAVNLRTLPSVEHEDVEVIAQLKNGDVATCVGTSDNGWSKLIYRGSTCYAVSSYLTSASEVLENQGDDFDITFQTCEETVTTNDKVNLRNIPSTERQDAKVITQLISGEVATRIGVSSNGWSKLIYNGTVCYAVSRYLVVAEENPSAASVAENVQTQFTQVNDRVTAKVEVNLRSLPSVEDPNCVVVAKLTNGEVVARTGVNLDLGWSRVEYQGQTLYCVSSYLKVVE